MDPLTFTLYLALSGAIGFALAGLGDKE